MWKMLVCALCCSAVLLACSSATHTGLFAGNDASTVDGEDGGLTLTPDVATEAGSADGGSCGSAMKTCDSTCVSSTDPRTGCGAPSCEPCSIARGTARCSEDGICAVAKCDTGRADCNGKGTDGCEADLTSDPLHCGSCATACAKDQVCGPLGCSTTCPDGLAKCDASCVDLTSSPEHCGTCATKCPTPTNGVAKCTNNQCQPSCNAGFHACGGQCVAESVNSCGASCTVCPRPANSTPACSSGGACSFTCASGFALCSGGTACCPTNPTCSYTGTTSCLSNLAMGIVQGDIGADVVSKTGTSSTWFSITVSEADTGFAMPSMKFTATLQSPPGMNFDLYAYESPCGGALYGQSNNAGASDTVMGTWVDTFLADDVRTVLFEVRYVSGTACGSAATWSLVVEGNK